MAFLEKFLAAWLLMILAIAGGAALVGVLIGILVAWGWILAHVPTWAEYVINFIGVSVIAALIIASIEQTHESD